MAELRYYADLRDRRHGQPTRLTFDTVTEAWRALDRLPGALDADVLNDAGQSVPAAFRELTDSTPDPDRVLRHRWMVDGINGFSQAPITQDGAQVFTMSTTPKRGRVTASASGEGNHRTWWLREGTRWPDSAIRSVWWAPSSFTVARPQMGHVHNAYVGEDGRLRGVIVWYNIVGGPNPDGLLFNMWESDGTSLWQGVQTTGGSRDGTDRAGRVLWANRFTFGVTLVDLNLHPHWAADSIVANSTGVLSGMAATGLNGSYTVQGGVEHGGLIRLTSGAAADLNDPIAGGTWTPDFPWRVMPYVVLSVYRPPTLWVKQWAYGRPEPDWGGMHSWSATIATDADTVEVPGGDGRPGLCGLFSGHAHTSHWMEWGDPTFSRAAAQAA